MELQSRGQFLNFAGGMLGSLALLAIGLSWLMSIELVPRLTWNWQAMAWGFAAVLPLALMFVAVYRLPWSATRNIRDFLQRELAPLLAQLTWFELFLLAALTGVAEELFFRGWLEPAIVLGWGWLAGKIGLGSLSVAGQTWLGRLVGNGIFGLAHVVTVTYGICAGLVGIYLSWLQTVVEPNNLLVPIVTHGVYDFFGFVMMVRLYRREAPRISE